MFLSVAQLMPLEMGDVCGHVGTVPGWNMLCVVSCTQRKWHITILLDFIYLNINYSVIDVLPVTFHRAQSDRDTEPNTISQTEK